MIPVEMESIDVDAVALARHLCDLAGARAAALVCAVVSPTDPTRTIAAHEIALLREHADLPVVTLTQVVGALGERIQPAAG